MRSFHGQTGRLERPACLLNQSYKMMHLRQPGQKKYYKLELQKMSKNTSNLWCTRLSHHYFVHWQNQPQIIFFFCYLSFSQKRLKISNDFELFCSSKIPYKIKLKKKLNGNECRVKAQKHLDTNPNMHNVSNLTGLVLVMFNSKSRHSAQGNTHLTDEFQSPL